MCLHPELHLLGSMAAPTCTRRNAQRRLQLCPRAVSLNGTALLPKGFKEMKTLLASVVAGALLVLICHCGSSSYTPPPNPDGGAGALTLTVNNFDTWCTLTVNGASQASALVAYDVDAGAVVAVKAVANASFTFDYWLGTDGANAGNSGKDPNASTTVTMANVNKTVLACCDNATLRCPTSL